MSFTVGIIGGGVAGSTIAIKLSQVQVKSVLFQAGPSLVNGPPMCHLHAGGALYRQIPTEHCIKLLKQSINTLRLYKYSANVRPTLLTVPLRDPGDPQDIINRLKILTQKYRELIKEDSENAVLGDPQDYYRVFTKQEVERLSSLQIPPEPKTIQDWLIPPAKNLNLSQFKFPFIMVSQYGLSSLRTSAFANLALKNNEHCEVKTNTKVTKIQKTISNRWLVTYKTNNEVKQNKFNYLVNACGYMSGAIDDMAGFKRKRMLQFKAAYITNWGECEGRWPEIIIHGKRNTPHGMAQLTPYAGGYFQIHGMTDQITLFKNGLVKSNDHTSQPQFEQKIHQKLKLGWQRCQVVQRTKKAIDHVAQFIPSFRSAIETKKPLYGAQQIPGQDSSLRASQISFQQGNYARAEIVKASTAITVANQLIEKLEQITEINMLKTPNNFSSSLTRQEVVKKGQQLAIQRNYPAQIAQFYY